MKFNSIGLLIALLFGICEIHSQVKDAEAYPIHTKTSIDELRAHPTSFSDEEASNIYLEYISSFLMSRPDTTFGLYRQMARFGIENNMKAVVSQAYSGCAFMHSYYSRQDSNLHYIKLALSYAPTTRDSILLLGSVGNVLMITGELDSAAYYIDKGLDQAQGINDSTHLSVVYLQKAYLLKSQQKFHSALYYALESLKLSDKAWTNMKRANAFQTIGDLYMAVNDTKKSAQYFQEALVICKEYGYPRYESEILAKLAFVDSETGDIDKSIEEYNRAIPYNIERKNSAELVNIYSNLAKNYLKLKDSKQAKEYLDLASEWVEGIEYDFSEIIFYEARGRYALLNKNVIESKASFNTMLSLSKDNLYHSKVSAYQGLQDVAAVEKDWQSAFDYSQIIKEMQSEIDLDRQKRLIYDLEGKYENDIKNAKIQRLQSENIVRELELEKRNRQLMFSIIALLLSIAAIYAFYNAYTLKRKLSEKLQASLNTNKMLIKEIHHRVKNNLQVVSSLLNIQSRFEKNDSVIRAINSGKNRVQSMSLLHQNLYVNEDLTSVKIKDYFEDLVNTLIDGYPLQGKGVQVEMNIDDIELDVDTLVPLGLIANELVTNSLKYAFNDSKSVYRLYFNIEEVEGKVRLTIKDNGPGLPFEEIPRKTSSMGMQLIQSFSHKLNAIVEIDNFNGAEVKLTFDIPKPKSSITYVAS